MRAKVAAFERLLLDRNRDVAARNRQAEDAFNTYGPEAFVQEVQRGPGHLGVPRWPRRVVRRPVPARVR